MANLIEENLVSVLLADASVSAITTNIHVNEVPPEATEPFIWLQLDDETEDLDLDGSGGIVENIFDIECVSTDIAVSKSLQKSVKSLLHGYESTTNVFGDQNIASAEVIGKDDSYEPRSTAGLTADFHVSALTLEIITDGR